MSEHEDGGSSMTTKACPECGASMTVRHGPRGDFLGCTRYPNCRGTRSVDSRQREFPGSQPPQREQMAPSASAEDLLTALRRAAGHLGAAIDILERLGPELDRQLSKTVHPPAHEAEEDLPF